MLVIRELAKMPAKTAAGVPKIKFSEAKTKAMKNFSANYKHFWKTKQCTIFWINRTS